MKNDKRPLGFTRCSFRKRTVLAGCLGLLLLCPRVILADDENPSLAAFNRAVQAADPGQAEESFKRDHPDPPSKADVGKLVTTIVNAAMSAMDLASDFQKHYPQSKQPAGIDDSLVETLWSVFGSRGFPVPKNRAADLEACTRRLIHDRPNDVRLYMVLCRVAAVSPAARQQTLYEELSRESTPGPARSMARGALRKLKRIGLPMDFNFTALDGRQVSLAELKGKVVLVDFWATTCGPCVRDLPELKQLYAKYNAQGLEIVGISLDSDRVALTRFVEREKIPWPQYYDPAGETNRLAQLYGIGSIPVVWLVDRHGVLRQLNGRDDQEKKVAALLKE
jgi:thiol-disulfide isomerase/thioredoxin